MRRGAINNAVERRRADLGVVEAQWSTVGGGDRVSRATPCVE